MMLTFLFNRVAKIQTACRVCRRTVVAVNLIGCCFMHDALGQGPLSKIWDYRFGGTNIDVTTTFEGTADGGYILGGYTLSQAGGDKSEPTWNGTSDFWIVKTNAQGSKQWDKDFGGFGADYLYTIKQTRDGGFILG